MAKSQQTAEQSYEQSVALTRDLLAKLELVIDSNPPTGDAKINWGHVGNINEMNARLTEILSFIGG